MSRIGKKPVPLPKGVTAAVEGKTVKVTGQLDQQANILHVESIEAAEA